MSSAVNQRQPIDHLSEDVLAEIFSHVDGDELLDLQLVCRKWHRVINTLINWKTILERKMTSSVTWWQVEKRLDHSAPETRSDCKLLYRNIRRKIQELDHHWRSGKFSELDIQIDDERTRGADDDFLLNFKDGNAKVYDRRRLQILHNVPGQYAFYDCRLCNGWLFLTERGRGYRIVDAKTGSEIGRLNDANYIRRVTMGSQIVAVVNEGITDGRYSLFQLWLQEDDGFELVHEHEHKTMNFRVDVDDDHLVIFRGRSNRFEDFSFSVCIVNFENEDMRSMGMRGGTLAPFYGQGILFLIYRNGDIRLMDVSTGYWLRTIRHEPWKCFFAGDDFDHWMPVAANSKFLAILDKDTERTDNSTIDIYDLVSAKDLSADSDGLLLVTIHVPGFIFCRGIEMNETEIYGIGGKCEGDEEEFFKAFDFLDSGTGHQVVCSITQRGRVIRRSARYGQAKLHKRR